MKISRTVEELWDKARVYLPEASLAKIQLAYDVATAAHEGQVRGSGEAYITHPLEVAYILADLEQDEATICAGLLHDTIEDTAVTQHDIVSKFGEDVYHLVEGVTKLNKLSFNSKEELQAENFRKMFLAMARDIRVVIIKLADRLHNMRTLKFIPKDKQMRIASVTRDIFAPLAHRLGMWRIKWELEDLAFYYLQYDEFQEIKRLVASRRDERESYVKSFTDQIKLLLAEHVMEGKIYGRPKHFYSIYKKLSSQELSFDELYDALGVRVIVGDIKTCYMMLGLVHSQFKPVNGRFKDYIAMPKSNMYQSLHTTVIGPGGKPVEVQIRTPEMDQIAEYGIAAHWRYKEGQVSGSYDANFAWLRQIIDQHQDKSAPQDFLQTLKLDLFIDEVFIFTPKGEIQTLPLGSTPVDFAYKVHSEIGNCCVGAKVNGHIVTLDYHLKSGDRVEIMTSKKSRPNIDWLQFVKTGQAKTRIKQWFKRQDSTENIKKARLKLDKVLIVDGFLPRDIWSKALIESFLSTTKYSSMDEVCLLMSQGEVSVRDIANQIKTLFTKQHEATLDAQQAVNPTTTQLRRTNLEDVLVLGESQVMAYLAKCCHPIPGEAIVGFITMGHGVAVHSSDCQQILHLEEAHRPRIVEAKWRQGVSSYYETTLRIEAFDRIGILKDILNKFSESKTNVSKVQTKTIGSGGKMRAVIKFQVRDMRHLNQVKQGIANIADVLSISRVRE